MLFFGVFMITQVVTPIVSYRLWEVKLSNENKPLLSAIPTDSNVLGISVENNNNFPSFISRSNRTTPAPYSDFYLTIPKINLEEVEVKVDSNVFDQYLALLPGTALPGEQGNVFITGHSSAPLVSKDIKAIFANLPDLKVDDTVYLTVGTNRYDYQIVSLKIVDPKDTSVINPPDDKGRYLTLMTCVPPGSYSKRLVILAKLI